MSIRACFLATLSLLVACGGATVRPTDDTGGVSPAPSPAPSTPVVDPTDPAPPPAPAPEAPAAPATGPADSAAPGSDVEIRRIGSWISSGIKGSRRLVIRDSTTWSRFWSELGAGVQPEVDFGRDLVVAVASGEQSSGGHDIAIQGVTREGGELRVEVLETSASPECMTTAALTQPVDVVMVPTSGVTGWSFVDRKATRPC